MSDRARRPRRTWPQRAFLAFGLGMIVICLLVAGGLAYTYSKVSDIARVQLSDVLTTDKGAGRNAPENILIVGTDSADGLAPDDPVLFGRPPGIRSDTI